MLCFIHRFLSCSVFKDTVKGTWLSSNAHTCALGVRVFSLKPTRGLCFFTETCGSVLSSFREIISPNGPRASDDLSSFNSLHFNANQTEPCMRRRNIGVHQVGPTCADWTHSIPDLLSPYPLTPIGSPDAAAVCRGHGFRYYLCHSYSRG